jgi:hypothetical protein
VSGLQLSKNIYIHMGHAYSIVSKNEQLEKLLSDFDLAKSID